MKKNKLTAVILIALWLPCVSCLPQIREKEKPSPTTTTKTTPPPPALKPSVTTSQYNALKEGATTFDEAVKMLGTRYEVKYESKDKTGSSGVYQWGNADDGFILLQFQNRKVYSKSQISLKH